MGQKNKSKKIDICSRKVHCCLLIKKRWVDDIETLRSAPPERAVTLLRKIEKEGQGSLGLARKLLPFIEHEDYMVRSRAFIAIARLKDSSVGNDLIAYIKSNPGEEWQLRVLECLRHYQDASLAVKLAVFLGNEKNPLLVRGCLWLIGYLGGKEAIQIISTFAARPQGRLVRDEVILEALVLAASSFEGGAEYFQELTRKEPEIGRFFRYMMLPEIEQPRFDVYPYPDYLLDQAKARGIKPKEFRKLFFWHREK